MLKSIIYPFLGAPFLFMFIVAMAGAGEIVYRNLFPNKLALEKMFTFAGLRSREVLIGLLAGLACFAVGLGYQITYYWIGHHFHFWCPLEVNSYKILSAYCPWFGAVNLGIFAASNEEILYRVLMLGLSRYVVRKFWLANLLQAAAWGFMHSTYPQQPCYARGLELTIEGIFDGWVISRFGLLACLVSHYCFDAFQDVIPLFNAPMSLKLSSVLPFLPILIAIVYSAILRSKAKPEQEQLLNSSISINAPVLSKFRIENVSSELVYKALSFKARCILICFIIAGLILHLPCGEKSYHIGETTKPLHITRKQAIKRAQEYLSDEHINLNDYKIGTAIGNNFHSEVLHQGVQYVFEHLGFERTKKLVDQIESAFVWSVRFVKPLEPSEYEARIHDNGSIGLDVQKGDDQEGANLNEQQAQIIAENYLKTQRKLYTPFELKDISQTKRKHRTDYHLTFTVPKYKIADADFKITIDIIGDIPANVSHFWDVPDKWKWERTKLTKKQEIYSIVGSFSSVAIFIASILWIVALFRGNKVRWRVAMYLAGLACISSIIGGLNNLTGFFNSYNTTVPLNTFFIFGIIGAIVGIIFMWGVTTFVIAVVLAGISETLKSRFKSTLFSIISPPQDQQLIKLHWNLWLDAIVLALALDIALYLVGLAVFPLNLILNHEVSIGSGSGLFSVVNTFFGPLELGLRLAVSLMSVPLLFGMVIAICQKLRLTNYWRFCGLIMLLYILSGLNMRYWQDSLSAFMAVIVFSIIAWFSVTRIFNRNILSAFVYLWISVTFPSVYEFWKFGWPTFSKELIIACVFLLYPFIYLLYLYVRMTRPKTNRISQ